MKKDTLSDLIRSCISIAGGADALVKKLKEIPLHYFKPEVMVTIPDWEKIVGLEKPQLPIELTVNYGLGINKLISHAGIISYSKDTFLKRIRVVASSVGKKRFLFDIVEITEDMTAAQLTDLIAIDGWSFAGIEHLLTFSIRFPDEHMKGEIEALGCFWRECVRREERQIPIVIRNYGKTKRRKSLYIPNIMRWSYFSGIYWEKGTRILKIKPL